MSYQGRTPTLNIASKLDPFIIDGTQTSYNLRRNGNPVSPGLSENIIVSINGVIQEPGVAYTVIGAIISFSEPPIAGQECFIVAGSLKMGQTTQGVSKEGDTMGGALGFAPIQSVASAATVNLASINSNSVFITGTTNITSFGAAASGTLKIVKFSGQLTLSHGASLILPGQENLKTDINDTAIFEATASNIWYCIAYSRANVHAGMIANAELANLDTLTKSGIYRLNGGNSGGPFSGNLFGMLFVMQSFEDTLAQLYIDHATSKSYTRGGSGSGSNWGPWRESVDTDSYQQLVNKNIIEITSVVGVNTTAVAGTKYILTASIELTLPLNPIAGECVGIVDRSGTTTSIIRRNGKLIMSLAEDSTVDVPNFSATLMYTDATRGWVIL